MEITSYFRETNDQMGGGNGNPLHYSCLKNPIDIGAWQAVGCGGHREWDTTE